MDQPAGGGGGAGRARERGSGRDPAGHQRRARGEPPHSGRGGDSRPGGHTHQLAGREAENAPEGRFHR